MRVSILFQTALLVLYGVVCQPALAAEYSLRPKARISLSDMVGQMIIVGFSGASEQDAGVQAVQRQIASGQIGGVLLLGRNILDPQQTTHLTQALRQSAAGAFALPPFISVDQEGGQVQRLTNRKGFEGWLSAEEVSELNDKYGPAFTINYYGDRAKSLADAGINLNFGPVVDLDSNPANPIIGRLERSFSQDYEIVAAIGGDFVIAHRNAGVFTSPKHFPGHGSSESDSHRTLPDISTSWRSDELLPYRSLARRGLVDGIMIAHVFHPDFSDSADMPTSLSKKAVMEARAIVGDAPVLFSDDMHMKAITGFFREEDAAILAINAGIDVLVYSTFDNPDPGIGPRINKTIVEAVRRGEIAPGRIKAAHARITALKTRY